jgi:hypothetical protein
MGRGMPIDWAIIELVVEATTRGWDAIRNRRSPYNTERFLAAHDENLKRSIDNLQDISTHSVEVLAENARGVLRMISAVVKANIRDQNVEVNANYMIPRPAAQDLMDGALFCDRKRRSDSYGCFLTLQAWAHDAPDLPNPVILPVDKAGNEMLFGAPAAYSKNQTQILRNTRKAHKLIDKNKHREIRQQVENYFSENGQHIRSFASLPIRVPPFLTRPELQHFTCASTDTIGVVNVQSSKTSVLGVFEGNQRKLEMALAPFVHVLAHHVLRLHYVAGAAKPGGA